jgi:hypothetical protein
MPSEIPGLLVNVAHSDKDPRSLSCAFSRQSRPAELLTAQPFAGAFLSFFTSAKYAGH